MFRRAVALTMAILALFCAPIRAFSFEGVQLPGKMIKGAATAYKQHGITASGEHTRKGICAGSREYLGKTIILYQRLPDNSVGQIIGIYDCRDTGGTKGLKNGTVIDVWQPDISSCKRFMERVYDDDCHGKVWIHVLD